MTGLARWIALRIWIGIIWLVRRPTLRRWQRRSYEIWPEPLRSRMRASMLRQHRLARRYGPSLLTYSILVLLASIALTVCFLTAIRLSDMGILGAPPVRERG